MSKSMNMLRTRRRDNNVKPNRRLDRKSSRGMIYENEELRLKTININAEIERGQSDIKKLRRENEMLKKEIWYLRDEYEKLDKLLKQKPVDFTSSSSTCSSSDSESSISEDSKEVETTQNFENVQKTNLKNLHVEFDHLSVVPEEPSTENSDKSTRTDEVDDASSGILQPDQGYPDFPMAKHFFAPLPSRPMTPPPVQPFYTFRNDATVRSPDLIVKMDNRHFASSAPHSNSSAECACPMSDQKYVNDLMGATPPRSSFSNGGNLEELLNDIQTISEDILKMSSPPKLEEMLLVHQEQLGNGGNAEIVSGHYPLERSAFNGHFGQLDQLSNENLQGNSSKDLDEKYKSEISVVLMPTPMPLIGFEKYKNLSTDNLNYNLKLPATYQEELQSSRSNLLELSHSSDQMNSDTDADTIKPALPEIAEACLDLKIPEKEKKMSIRRKVSIHFKGRKDKKAKDPKEEPADISIPIPPPQGQPALIVSIPSTSGTSTNSALPLVPLVIATTSNSGHQSSDSERPSASKHQNKSTSASPERQESKKHHKHKKHKTKNAMTSLLRQRRNTLSTDRLHRERSFSICTDRSNLGGHGGHYMTDDYLPSSDRERTNSLSSCGTNNGNTARRKFSNVSQFPSGSAGKIPWCACWGNGCI